MGDKGTYNAVSHQNLSKCDVRNRSLTQPDLLSQPNNDESVAI